MFTQSDNQTKPRPFLFFLIWHLHIADKKLQQSFINLYFGYEGSTNSPLPLLQALYEPVSGSWVLLVASLQPRDRGVYECQLGTTPPRSHYVTLRIVGQSETLGHVDISAIAYCVQRYSRGH